MPTTPTRIAILDEDHVVGLVQALLTADRSEAEFKLKAFFAPEACDLTAVWTALSGLTARFAIQVVKCKRPEDAIGAAILLFRRGQVAGDMIDSNPALRLIQRWGERSDMIDCQAASKNGVWVSCLARPSLHFVAEHVLMLMMALAKKLRACSESVRNTSESNAGGMDGETRYNWPGLPGIGGLYGRTLGIVGVGEIGTLVARRARALGMKVIYTNRARLPVDEEVVLGVEYRGLDDLLGESDFVSLHATNLAENEKLMNTSRFAKMKRDAFFINTSRGRFVDEDALFAALNKRAIAGAGLDVHRQEPRPYADRFFGLDNVILTPHLAGGSRLGTLGEINAVLDNFRAALDGQPPVHGRIV